VPTFQCRGLVRFATSMDSSRQPCVSSDAYEVAAVELEVTGRTLMVRSTSEKTLAVCSLPPRGIQSFVGTNFFRTPR
jgi:hypothetical protein